MSDFDKEAERERLREKYERDRRKREATEQMSELLLKGATMTNAHCGECGDPIFRYDGQEFCPSCQTVVDEIDDADGNAETATHERTETTGESGERADTTPADDPDSTPTADAEVPEWTTDDADARNEGGTTDSSTSPTADSSTRPAADSPTRATADSGVSGDDRQQATPSVSGGEPPATITESSTATSEGVDASDLVDARASLARTVTRLARQAERSDDLGRTREYLAAAHDAAEALAAVKRADD